MRTLLLPKGLGGADVFLLNLIANSIGKLVIVTYLQASNFNVCLTVTNTPDL